jgi:arylsulfatase A-like enzyme
MSGAVAESLDLYPTLADLAGLEPPAYLAGASLRPALEDISAQGKSAALTVFQTTDRQHGDGPKHRPSELSYSIRTERWRYTEWGARGWQGVELYDHRLDPQEITNLAADPAYSNEVEMLSALLARRVDAATTPPRSQP